VSSLLSRLPPRSPLFPYTTLFRSGRANRARRRRVLGAHASPGRTPFPAAYPPTRKNTASVCSAQEIGASSGMVFSGLVTRSAPGPSATSAVTSQWPRTTPRIASARSASTPVSRPPRGGRVSGRGRVSGTADLRVAAEGDEGEVAQGEGARSQVAAVGARPGVEPHRAEAGRHGVRAEAQTGEADIRHEPGPVVRGAARPDAGGRPEVRGVVRGGAGAAVQGDVVHRQRRERPGGPGAHDRAVAVAEQGEPGVPVH